jgi:hypothetical protein
MVRRANLQTTGTIFNKETQRNRKKCVCRWDWYRHSAVRDAYLELEREATKVGLNQMNKRQNIYSPERYRIIRDVWQSVAIGDKHFVAVNEFMYLGFLMTPTNNTSRRRIQTAKRCFFGLRKHLQSRHLSRQTKFTIHKSLVRPVLLYGIVRRGCWPKGRTINCSYLRGRFSEQYAVYRRRYNHELDKDFNSPNVLNVTKTSRLRYSGHMIRKLEELPQKVRFRSKLNERTNQGRSKSRWAFCAQDMQTLRDLLQQAYTRYLL